MAHKDKTKDQLVEILDVVGVQEDVEMRRLHGKAQSVIERLALEGEVIDGSTGKSNPWGWLWEVRELTAVP